jgi:hypothetical protein
MRPPAYGQNDGTWAGSAVESYKEPGAGAAVGEKYDESASAVGYLAIARCGRFQ